MRKENLHFKVSSGLKDIIGKDLITNEIVAIFELVKNSYDAGASNVDITINSENDEIIISDDGNGMSYEEIKNKWLFVAHSEKKYDDNKVYAGSKGIGRFSCDRLGGKLILVSKKNNQYGKLSIDWNKFEKDTTEKFESLNVFYEDIIKNEYLDKFNSGTVLKISNLHDLWDKKRTNKIIRALERLINPFASEKNINIKVSLIESKLNIPSIDEIVENKILKVLDTKTIFIYCTIKDGKIEIKLVDKTDLIYEVSIVNNTLISEAEFKIYYLNRIAKVNFTRVMQVNPKEYGSIFLYKNNFRVFPYGETNFDAFGLNLRKNQGYNRFLGHRELLGWINIVDKENHFKEVTSRDRGFIENMYTLELEKTYYDMIQRPLEDYMQLVKFGDIDVFDAVKDEVNSVEKLVKRFKKYEVLNIDIYSLPIYSRPIEDRLKVLSDPDIDKKEKQELERNVKKIVIETKKELNKELKKNKEIEKESEILKNEIEIKNRIIRDINPERQKTLTHELSKVSKDIQGSLNRMNRRLDNKEKLKYLEFFSDLRRASDKLSSIKKMILKINLDSQNEKEKIELKSFIESYFKNAITDERVTTNIKFDEVSLIKEINIFDFGIILDNIVLNATEMSVETINIYSEDNIIISIVTDTGPIKVEPIERIFDLGFTTKNYGSGMGMFIVRQIIEEFGWSISVENLKNNLVEFKINTNGEKL